MKPFIAALVTLDPDTLPEQLEHLGLPRSLSIPEAAVHPAVRAAIQKLVDEANQLVSRAEGHSRVPYYEPRSDRGRMAT